MVTKRRIWMILALLATASLVEARKLAYDVEAEFQAVNAATAPTVTAQQATVPQVVGIVRARKSENDAWQPVKVGDVFEEGVEFRTAPRSRVGFTVPPDQTIILDRLGVVKLLIAKRTGNGVRTSLGMPYGRTEYQVEEAGRSDKGDIAAT